MLPELDFDYEIVKRGRRWRILWGPRVIARLDYDRESQAWTLHGRVPQLADRRKVWPANRLGRPSRDGTLMPPIWREIIFELAGWAFEIALETAEDSE